MGRRLLYIATTWLVLCAGASSAFNWFNTTTNRVTYANSTNGLFGVVTNANISCFVQLIYAGTNNIVDPASDVGTGVSGDDVVIAKAWAGKEPSSAAGVVGLSPMATNDVPGQRFYVRAWSAPALDFTNGLVRATGTNRYGDSVIFTNPCPGCDFPNEASINFGGTGFAARLFPNYTDTDGDGMPDWWESLFYPTATNGVPGDDDDVDGQINYNEYVSGTDPTNDLSVFELITIEGPTNGSVIVYWSSVADKTYSVMRSTNDLASSSTLASNIVAVPPLNSFTDTISGAESPTYGIGVK